MATRTKYNPTPEERKDDINFASLINGVGSLTSAQTLNLRGINNNPNGSMAPTNKDSYGLTFFTRPDLNMSYDNIARDRMLTPLLSMDSRSMARALRCMLCPRLMLEDPKYGSAVIDNEMAFIPVLTNNLLSISGWPDFTIDTYSSKKGVYNEEWSMVDSTSSIYSTFNLTANFKNIQGDPISLLFFIWVRYASLVYDGTMTPWFDNIMENTIDYNTRIYRLVLNENRTYVQKIGACGAAFPMASPLGNYFNYTNDSTFNYENDQISIPFKCMGANYMDPILIIEFNATVEMHCASMLDKNRGSSMVKISPHVEYPPHGYIGVLLNNYLRHQLYPRIDPLTLELEWWAKKDVFDAAINELKKRGVFAPDFHSAVHIPAEIEHDGGFEWRVTGDDASLGTSGNDVSNIA